MTPALLHAVARKAEAVTPDAELLARYLADRDQSAFEELVRRHGPLVWAVCRHLLPCPADAEDAFQAVFLTLVRSAATIRDGRAVPAWLHGVAVRIATRAKREFARRRRREQAAASPEADRPVSDAAWESLAAAVHEEVQKLPEAERTAFVLCELQGVSQADAAARLGWPLGSVSGRLCKARQRLLDRLAARGVAPAAVVGIGITSGTACAVPSNLFEVVKAFPGAPGAASSAATVLARGLVEGVTMRVKLTAAVAVVAAAFGMTGGAVLLSKADAQPPETGGAFGGAGGLTPGADPFGQPPGTGKGKPPPGPGAGPGAPGAAGGPPGFAGGGGWSVSPATWEYKFVDIKNDRREFEKTITAQGKDGWEFCSSERFGQGEIVLVFKKRKGGDFPFGTGGLNVPGLPGGMGGWRDWPGGLGGGGFEARVFSVQGGTAEEIAKKVLQAHPKAVKVIGEGRANMVIVVADSATMKQIAETIEGLDKKPGDRPKPRPEPGPMPGGGLGSPPPGVGPMGGRLVPGGPMGFGVPAAGKLTVITLKNAAAANLEPVLKKVFPEAQITAEARSNTLIVRADAKTLEELQALVIRLDADSDNAPPKKK